MAQKILLKRSSTASKVPATTDLDLGELGYNSHDGRLFAKKNDGADAIVEYAKKSLVDAKANQVDLDNHLSDHGNPHAVTLSMLGGIHISQKGAASGVAELDANSKIPEAQLPAIAITDTHEASSETAQLALTVQKGDVCVRTDLNKSYINTTGNNAVMSDWTELRTPTDAVLSVNSKTGAVVLNGTDVDLSSYSKPASSGAIGSSDTIQAAIGKLEKGLDNAVAGGGEMNVQADFNQADTGADDYIKNKPVVGDAGLTEKNFTGTLLSKLNGIAAGAEVNVQADWNAASGDAAIANKPTIPAAIKDLSDVPSYTGKGGMLLGVNAAANAIEYINTINGGSF